MLQIDKTLVVLPSNHPLDERVFLSDDLLEVQDKDRVRQVRFNASPADNSDVHREVVCDVIHVDKGETSPQLVQMYLRRSSALFVVIPHSTDDRYARYMAMMPIKVCGSYNKFSPCTGPRTDLHYILIDHNADQLSNFIRSTLRMAKGQPLSIRYTAISEAPAGYEEDYSEEAQVEWLPLGTTFFDVLRRDYISRASHWRAIPSIRSGTLRDDPTLAKINECISRIKNSGQVIVDTDSLFSAISKEIKDTENDFLRYDFNLWMDALDKRGDIRLYELTQEVFLDYARYNLIATHVLNRIGAMPVKSAEGKAILELRDLVEGDIATYYLRALDKIQQHKIVRSILTELIESEVVHRGTFGAHECIITNEAFPIAMRSDRRPVNKQAICDIMAGLHAQHYSSPKPKELIFDTPGNVGFMLVPVPGDEGLHFMSIFWNGKSTDLPMYFAAIREPEKNTQIIRDFWSSKPKFYALNLATSLASQVKSYIAMRTNINKVNDIIVRAAEEKHLSTTVSWLCLDDILKPKKEDWVEAMRTNLRNHAVRAACSHLPTRPPTLESAPDRYKQLVELMDRAKTVARDLQDREAFAR